MMPEGGIGGKNMCNLWDRMGYGRRQGGTTAAGVVFQPLEICKIRSCSVMYITTITVYGIKTKSQSRLVYRVSNSCGWQERQS
jgi:hypothetical protein